MKAIQNKIHFLILISILLCGNQLHAQSCSGDTYLYFGGSCEVGVGCGAYDIFHHSHPLFLNYRHKDVYVPNYADPLNSPPEDVTIKLAFHIFRGKFATQIFQDNDQGIAIIKDYVLNNLNSIFENGTIEKNGIVYTGPTVDPPNGVDVLQGYDTKINFSIGEPGNERIYYYDSHDCSYSVHLCDEPLYNQGYDKYGVKNYVSAAGNYDPNVVNIFVNNAEKTSCQSNSDDPNVFDYDLFGDGAASSVGSNYCMEDIPLEPMVFMSGASHKFSEGFYHESDPDKIENHWSYFSSLLAHEMGHILGLSHTMEENDQTDPLSNEFLSDVFWNGCNEPLIGVWDAIDVDNYPEPCAFNNIMSYNNLQNYISPMQAGIMHRTLHFSKMSRVLEGCPYSEVPLEINQDETWDYEMRSFRDIIVKTGNTLTLTCKLLMPSQGRIIIERGARLIVDGGSIDAACEGERWRGIEVLGNSGQPQSFNMINTNYVLSSNPNGPGILILKDACISNGSNGTIVTMDKDTYGTPEGDLFHGGLIVAENTTFHNNIRSIGMVEYLHPNFSRFENCSFTWEDDGDNNDEDDDDFESTLDPNRTKLSHVSLWAVEGVSFENCQFTGPETNTFAPNNEILEFKEDNRSFLGINCVRAVFSVEDGCTFSNLDKGIALDYSTALSGKNIIVDGTNNPIVFSDNWVGIFLNNVGTQIDVTNAEFINNRIGMITCGNSTMHVNQCRFTDSEAGIVNWRDYQNHTINCSIFEKCETAIIYNGLNENSTFEENIFNSNTNYDISITHAEKPDGTFIKNGEIVGALGSPSFPALNAFSNGEIDIFTSSDDSGSFLTEPFTYLHFQNTNDNYYPIVPNCESSTLCNNSMNFTNISSTNLPIAQYPISNQGGSQAGCIDINNIQGPIIGGGGGVIDVCDVKVTLSDIRAEIISIEELITKGDASELEDAIIFDPSSSISSQLIKEASPYISDDILMEVILHKKTKEDVKESILVMNAPLTDRLMTAVQKNLSANTYHNLQAIKDKFGPSPSVLLSNQLGTLKYQKTLKIDCLIQEAIDKKDEKTLVSLLLQEASVPAHIALSDYYVTVGKYKEAELIASRVSNDFLKAQQINIAVHSAEGIYRLNSTDIRTLQQIADDYTSEGQTKARALLTIYNVQQFNYHLPKIKVNKKVQESASVFRDLSIKFIPNPTSAFVKFDLHNLKANSLHIYNTSGQLQQSIPLDSHSETHTIDVSSLPRGLYFTECIGENFAIKGKLMIQR